MAEAIYFVKNTSGAPIPGKGEARPRWNGNDGYSFKPGETQALSEPEALHLTTHVKGLEVVSVHGRQGGPMDATFVIGTAKALQEHGIKADSDADKGTQRGRQPKK